MEFDGARVEAKLAEALALASCVLVSIPPDADGCPAFRALGEILGARAEPAWVGYLSTTGVYGDRNGGWVSERDPVAPDTPRAANRVLAESQWLSLPGARRAQVFRLGGIYGPGRSPFGAVRGGEAAPVDKPGHVFNRVHVEDIAGALLASMARSRPGEVVNLVDDHPCGQLEFYAEAARLLGLRAPPSTPFDAANLSAMARSFFEANRRVANARAKAVYGWRPTYPTCREGLAAILAAEGA